MGFEKNISNETPRAEMVSLVEMPLDERNKLQAELASIAYEREHEGEDVSTVSEGSKMLWWIQSGYARAYGDLEEVDLSDMKKLADQITYH